MADSPETGAPAGQPDQDSRRPLDCTPQWRHLEHGADIGVQGRGPTLAQAFEQAAVALTAVVCDPHRVQALQRVPVQCEAPDPEILFYQWLNTVIFEMAIRKMLFRRYEVSIQDHRLEAALWGEPVDPARHRPAVEPKGATFTQLAVTRDAQGCWVAQCIIDV